MIKYFLMIGLLAVSCAKNPAKNNATSSAPENCQTKTMIPANQPHDPYGFIVWNSLITKKPNQALTFYKRLFGWNSKRVDANSTMLLDKGIAFANIRKATPDQKGPPAWSPSVAVKNLEESIKTVTELGGKSPNKIINLGKPGRTVGIEDQQGNRISIHEIPAGQQFNRKTTILWNELHTNDAESVHRFYEKAFGWSACTTSLPNGAQYTRFINGENRVAGFYVSQGPVMTDVNLRWKPQMNVVDLQATLKKALSLKAKKIFEPSTVPNIGSFVELEDPFGAHFILFQPDPNFL
ncbi:MAG: hypothetical protein K2P81_17705 [Bacteriovoracaceae bacterium]|nr:hypothetical protein [Bacteriovoracaceae bacterium]